MYSAASGLYSCPLAMTDGAAKTLTKLGGRLPASDDRLMSPLEHLTSRDPEQFWTSGQWMTEKAGGSDVSAGTATTSAVDAADANSSCYRLYGQKWFSSATDSDMTLALARMPPDSGVKGLGMFYVRTRNEDGSLNGIKVGCGQSVLFSEGVLSGENL